MRADLFRTETDMLISRAYERRRACGETNFSACPDARIVFSTPRFSINHAGIGFARICEMGNACEGLNKSDVIEQRIAAVANQTVAGQEEEVC